MLASYNDQQLMKLAELFETGLDWRTIAGDVVRGETAYHLAWLDRYAEEPNLLEAQNGNWGDKMRTVFLRMAVGNPGVIAKNKRMIVDLRFKPLEAWEGAEPPLPVEELGEMLVAAHSAKYPMREGPFVECFAVESFIQSAFLQNRNERMYWNLAKSVVAVARFREMNDRDPAGWKDLVPEFLDEVPDDPYSEEGLKLGRDSDGVLFVYSVGEDEIDNQGDVESDVRWMTEMKGVNERDEE